MSKREQLLQMCAIVGIVAGGSGAARAGDDYGGSIEDAYKCSTEVDAWSAAKDGWAWLDDVVKGNKWSAACKPVFDQRFQACLRDPDMQSRLKDPDANHGIPNRVCHEQAFGGIWEQVVNDRQKTQHEAEEAKAKADEEAKRAAEVAARELPKATKHDAKLEKLVSAAYHKDYPEGTILKVILFDWSDDYEKDDFGRITGRDLDASVVNKQADGKCYIHNEYWMQLGNGRSFSGPLSARGAGSASDNEILCSKVEGAAKAAAKPAAKKK